MAKRVSLNQIFAQEVPAETYVEYVKDILESLGQPIVIIDIKQQVVFANSQTELLFGPIHEMIGNPVTKMFPAFAEEYRGKVLAYILTHEVLEMGETGEILGFPLATKDQKLRYFDVKANPLRDKKKKVLGAILVMNEVTNRIQLENQLLRQARTSSLANLGASVAHEVRNPLNSISLNIQLIKEGIDGPHKFSREEAVEILNNAITEIKRLNDIIRYFLEFSRPPAPQMVAEDPNVSVRQALFLLTKEAQQSDVVVIENLGLLPRIPLDRNQLAQAIYNICLNAIQEMRKQGGGKLEVTTLANKDYILLEFRDNGSGIAPGINERLFELFYTTKEDGSGLGLAIANQIVETHEGRIVAENNIDRGACFSIYLPVGSV
jgi:PAS domain S-box-containing protein